jgi:hypothetical protein
MLPVTARARLLAQARAAGKLLVFLIAAGFFRFIAARFLSSLRLSRFDSAPATSNLESFAISRLSSVHLRAGTSRKRAVPSLGFCNESR